MRSEFSRTSKWAIIMTTRSEVPGGGFSGAETDLGGSVGAIDAANLDRIARNLLSAIPGAIVPESAISAASALASPAIPSVPMSSAVATAASLYSGTPDAPCLATEMLNAVISQMPIVTPAAASAVAAQSVLPEARPRKQSCPVRYPQFPTLPRYLLTLLA